MRSPFRSFGAVVGRATHAIRRRTDPRVVLRRALGVVAVGGVLAAVLAVAGVLPESILRPVAGSARVLIVASGVVTLVAIALVRGLPSRDAATNEPDGDGADTERHHRWDDPLHATVPETVPSANGTRSHVPVTVAADQDPRLAHEILTRLADEQLATERLSEVAVETVAAGAGVTDDLAKEVIESGEWTTDRRAATYLSPDDHRLSARVRLRDWLAGESTARRVRATVRAITDRSRLDPSPASGVDGLTAGETPRTVGATGTPATTVTESAESGESTRSVESDDSDESVASSESPASPDTDDAPVELDDEQVRNVGALHWEVEQ